MVNKVAIRLGTEGKAEVLSDFNEITAGGEASAKRLTATYEQQAAAAARAAEKAAQTAAKIAAIAPQTATQMQIGDATGTGFGQHEGSARRSAMAMKELLDQEAEMERRTRSLISAIDPMWAAQQRANDKIREAKSLLEAGRISTDQYAAAERHAKGEVDAASQAYNRHGQSLGQVKAGYQQLSFQVGDVASQMATGTPFMTIFAQQAGQVVQAFGLISGGGGGGGGGADAVEESVGGLSETLDSATGAIETASGAAETLSGVLGGESAATEGNSAATGANTAQRDANTAATDVNAVAIGVDTVAHAENTVAEAANSTATATNTVTTEVNTTATAANAVAAEADTIATAELGAAKMSLSRIMGGPWGAAIIGGVTVLSMLIPKLMGAKDETKAAGEELEKQAKASEVAGRAAAAFAVSQEGVHDALLKAEDARKKATDGLISHAEASNIASKQNLELIDSNIRVAQSLLMVREANLQKARGANLGTGASSGPGQAAYDEVKALELRITELWGDRAKAEAEYEASRADLAVETGKRLADPIGKLNRQFDAEVTAARAAAKGNRELTASLTAQTEAIELRRKAAIKAAQDAERETKPHFGRDIAEGNRADLLAAAKRYDGLSEHSAHGKAVLEDLFHQANFNIDPEITKWCAAFVNAVLATQGLKGTGSLGARSFLGWGKSTNTPTAGDVVVSSAHGQDHVGFFQGFDAKGNVRLYSGNTSDKVGSSTVAAGNVLGFRRAPDAAEEFADEAKAAKEATDFLAKLREEVAKIEGSYDPAIEATRKLNEQLDIIDKAEKAGVITSSRAIIDQFGLTHKGAFGPADTSFMNVANDWQKDFNAKADQRGDAYMESANKAAQVVIDNFEEMKQAGEGFIDTVLDPQNWHSFGDLGKTILREIEAEFIKLAALNPLKNLLFNDGLPTLTGALGRLFGTKGESPPGFSDAIIGHNAAGTEYWGGGLTVVGESGMELVDLPKGSRISSAARTRQALAGSNDNRPVIHVDARGAFIDRDWWAEMNRIAQVHSDGAAIRGAAGGSEMALAELGQRGRQSLAGF